MKRTYLIGLAGVIFVLWTGIAAASERITDYHVDLTVEADGDLLVTETIQVIADRDLIRRGIYRDFPVRYQRSLGFIQYVDFDVETVLRDGQAEPYFIQAEGNSARLYIGDAERFVDRGAHTYEITYRTREQLNFSENGTELYWNLIGTGWAFPIDRFSAVVQLPTGARVSDLNTYSGRAGERGDAGAVRVSGNRLLVESRYGLASNEGVSLSAVWQNGLATPPSTFTELVDAIGDNVGFVFGLFALTGVAFYFHRTWQRYGKDPEKGVIIPLFTPPAGLSPVALGYIHARGFNGAVGANRALTVAITSLAIKGYLTIDEASKGYIIRLTGKEAHDLPPGEANLLDGLKAQALDGELVLDGTYKSSFGALKSAYLAVVEREYTKAYFNTNGGKWSAGAAVAVVTLVAAAVFSQRAGELMVLAGVLIAFFGIAFSLFLSLCRTLWRDWNGKKRGATVGSRVFNILGVAVSLGATGLTATGIVFFAGAPILLIAACLVALCTIFFWIMEAPTVYGRQIMDQIEGYLLFLTTTEWDRMQAREPMPTPDEALFEKHLAYSMALGVDEAWSKTFTKYALLASLPPVIYHASWYHSHSGGTPDFADFSSNFSSGMSSTFSSASSPPSSSSGSGGGGFSGGGGGGGGGGGW